MGGMKGSALSTSTLRCTLDIQMEVGRRQLDLSLELGEEISI